MAYVPPVRRIFAGADFRRADWRDAFVRAELSAIPHARYSSNGKKNGWVASDRRLTSVGGCYELGTLPALVHSAHVGRSTAKRSEVAPELRTLADGRLAACHRIEELPTWQAVEGVGFSPAVRARLAVIAGRRAALEVPIEPGGPSVTPKVSG
jgi:hypothetical protein